MPVYGSSMDDLGNRTWIFLYGNPKVGKTVAAATMGASCPTELPSPIKTKLEDMLWIGFDKNGTESLATMGLEVERVDLSGDMASRKQLADGIRDSFKFIQERVKSGKIKTLVVDTITALDIAFNVQQREIMDQKDNPGPFSNAILGRHMDFVLPLKDLPVSVIFIAHAKSNIAFMETKESESEKTRRKVSAIGGDVTKITGELTSKTGNWYKGQCSYIWPLVAKVEKGKDTIRMILPYGGYGYEGGSRAVGLDNEEPAHFGKIFEKIKKRIS